MHRLIYCQIKLAHLFLFSCDEHLSCVVSNKVICFDILKLGPVKITSCKWSIFIHVKLNYFLWDIEFMIMFSSSTTTLMNVFMRCFNVLKKFQSIYLNTSGTSPIQMRISSLSLRQNCQIRLVIKSMSLSELSLLFDLLIRQVYLIELSELFQLV